MVEHAVHIVNDDTKPARWVIGPEHDSALQRNLQAALRSLGYSSAESSWSLAGSQEISTLVVRGPDGVLTVEAETYIGLVVEGSRDLVEALRAAYISMFPTSPHL
jgi:hypothetical protein